VVALVVLAAFAASADAPIPASGDSFPLEERTFVVGPIYVEGADDMRASAILNEIDFRTGDRIPYRRLHEAERRLERLGLFVVDPASGVRPRVVPVSSEDNSAVRIVVVRKDQAAAPL
jgi:outer membrane protein assembly factor BamA